MMWLMVLGSTYDYAIVYRRSMYNIVQRVNERAIDIFIQCSMPDEMKGEPYIEPPAACGRPSELWNPKVLVATVQ
jgi:hypothetical protein